MPERAYERHAWKVLVVLHVIFLFFGVGDLILGADNDPAIPESVTGVSWSELKESNPRSANLINLLTRGSGAAFAAYSVLGIAVSATAFKKGERWAWYSLWTMPLLSILIAVTFLTTELVPGTFPPPLGSAPIFLIVSALALLLPYRKFFPKK